MPLVGLVEALLVVVPAEFEGDSSLANISLDALNTVDLGFIDLAWSLTSPLQRAAILPSLAVATIVSLLLLQVQQDPVVVGGNDGLHGGTAGVANLQSLGVEYLVQLRCFREVLLDKLDKPSANVSGDVTGKRGIKPGYLPPV